VKQPTSYKVETVQVPYAAPMLQHSIVCSLFITKHLCTIDYSVVNVTRMFPCVEKAFAPMIF